MANMFSVAICPVSQKTNGVGEASEPGGADETWSLVVGKPGRDPKVLALSPKDMESRA